MSFIGLVSDIDIPKISCLYYEKSKKLVFTFLFWFDHIIHCIPFIWNQLYHIGFRTPLQYHDIHLNNIYPVELEPVCQNVLHLNWSFKVVWEVSMIRSAPREIRSISWELTSLLHPCFSQTQQAKSGLGRYLRMRLPFLSPLRDLESHAAVVLSTMQTTEMTTQKYRGQSIHGLLGHCLTSICVEFGILSYTLIKWLVGILVAVWQAHRDWRHLRPPPFPLLPTLRGHHYHHLHCHYYYFVENLQSQSGCKSRNSFGPS